MRTFCRPDLPLPTLFCGPILCLMLGNSCTPSIPPATEQVRSALAWPLALATDATPRWTSDPAREETVSVTAITLPLLAPQASAAAPAFDVVATLFRPDQPTGASVIVAHGHFGEGKTGPEAQDIAWRLALRGATVLVVDTPGVEEWDVPGRQIHFDDGAHARTWLAAAGTSAMALQVAGLTRGIDLLAAHGATSIAAVGSSGGAVQAFYIGVIDDRINAVVMASGVPLPRELRASGCPCDQLPGLPGPDPRVLASLDRPGLWLTEVDGPRPEGLPRKVRFAVVPGDHGFPLEMQRRALAFLDDHLDLRERAWSDAVPHVDLHSPGAAADPDAPAIWNLPLPPVAAWVPRPDPDAPYELDCQGEGPVVLVAGGDALDRAGLVAAGAQACAVRSSLDSVSLAEVLGRGGAPVDVPAGALIRAAAARSAVAVFAVRGWALPAGATGLPMVVRDPLTRLDQLDLAVDPPWIHAPGAWTGAMAAHLAQAVASGTDRAQLIAALQPHLDGSGLDGSGLDGSGLDGSGLDGSGAAATP